MRITRKSLLLSLQRHVKRKLKLIMVNWSKDAVYVDHLGSIAHEHRVMQFCWKIQGQEQEIPKIKLTMGPIIDPCVTSS